MKTYTIDNDNAERSAMVRKFLGVPDPQPVTLLDAMRHAHTSEGQLAHDAQVQRHLIRSLLSGAIGLGSIDPDMAERIAFVLNVEVRDIVAGESARA